MTDKLPSRKFSCACDFGTLLQNLWKGRVPLFKVFWIYYFSIILGLGMIGAGLSFLDSIASLLAVIWAGFMVKPIWVAADLYEGPVHWALAAKAASVLIALGAIGDFLVF